MGDRGQHKGWGANWGVFKGGGTRMKSVPLNLRHQSYSCTAPSLLYPWGLPGAESKGEEGTEVTSRAATACFVSSWCRQPRVCYLALCRLLGICWEELEEFQVERDGQGGLLVLTSPRRHGKS